MRALTSSWSRTCFLCESFCGNSSDICAGQHISKYDGKYYNRVQSLGNDSLDGNCSANGGRDHFSVADVFKTSRLYENPGGSYHFRCDFRNFPRKFCADYLCGNPGHSYGVYFGDERKPVEQCSASYRCECVFSYSYGCSSKAFGA